MSKDYVPDSFQNFYNWAGDLSTGIATHAAAVGWDAARVTAFQAKVDPLHDAAKAVLDKQAELDALVGKFRMLKDQGLPSIRQDINNLKTSPGYNDGIGSALGILNPSANFDEANYQPQLKASVFPGHVRLTGKKLGVDALNLYSRRKGDTAWTLIAGKRSTFPYDDDAKLATAGTPEVREYMAMGVMGDDEIGLPSDIVSVTYGG